MAIARFPTIVLDCPDPLKLAEFYAALLGWQADLADDGHWAEAHPVPASDYPSLSFQQVESYTAPVWPGQDIPQQMHIDVVVADLDEAEAATLALGATKHDHQPGTTFRVYLDPAGHPFCLCQS